jgi:hypothetical protein
VADLERQAKTIQTNTKAMLARAAKDPDIQMVAQQDPQKAEQALAKVEEDAQGQIQQLQQEAMKLQETVTIDQVMEFLRDNKIRPFVLDIETDSTIFPDEMAEKAARNEFMGVFTQSAAALGTLIAASPQAAPVAGALLKFVLAPYRAGREMDGAIDEFVDGMMQQSQNPQPNPDVVKAQAQAEYDQGKLALEGQKLQKDDENAKAELSLRDREITLKERELQIKPQIEAQKETIKVQGNVQSKQADAQASVVREQAQLDADVQTKAMDLDAEAALEAQRQASEAAKAFVDEQFRRDELNVNTALAYDKLAVQQATAERASEAKANAPKPNGSGR